MKKAPIFAALSLATLLLTGCSTTWVMTTTSGTTIETQGKPEQDPGTGLTKYADAYGYHRVIKSSDVKQIDKGKTVLMW
ncbi:YgdI/YgdR family lipoprotein [Citrobacter cronae]|uniref:YgdI/YgdR family lipoprotein n=1 Tax=Citrobacter freundii complex TaxID=1344959 RepID=UPI001D0A4847|nr:MULTISPECIES: YgdI/YgdR family lipoprotein [Citrobacter]MCU6184757.1 YgdI/YgdR family lipoprotein [Citrobacter cronae]MCU6196182.1 YgdI/YgdR family lipoprotein [Citrobacter cronae]UBX46316.1 YgdI/YgdR family lipoprotein [Citrobacter werkmanii]